MKLTRDYKETIKERIKQDEAFARALFDEAIYLFLNGEAETARLILREVIDATIGFEALAIATSKPSKSLYRMLSAKGNPTMNNLTNIINIVRQNLNVNIQVKTVSCV